MLGRGQARDNAADGTDENEELQDGEDITIQPDTRRVSVLSIPHTRPLESFLSRLVFTRLHENGKVHRQELKANGKAFRQTALPIVQTFATGMNRYFKKKNWLEPFQTFLYGANVVACCWSLLGLGKDGDNLPKAHSAFAEVASFQGVPA